MALFNSPEEGAAYIREAFGYESGTEKLIRFSDMAAAAFETFKLERLAQYNKERDTLNAAYYLYSMHHVRTEDDKNKAHAEYSEKIAKLNRRYTKELLARAELMKSTVSEVSLAFAALGIVDDDDFKEASEEITIKHFVTQMEATEKTTKSSTDSTPPKGGKTYNVNPTRTDDEKNKDNEQTN